MKTDHQKIYASRNRHKVRRPIWTFDAAWNLAGTKSLEKWGETNASLYISTALCNQLRRDGVDVRKLISDAKNKCSNKPITCTDAGASLR
jgi:hypothetical protein